MRRVFSLGAPRKNHMWEIRHSAGPIRDVGAVGRDESVAGAQYKCGLEERCELADLECSFVTLFLCCNCLEVAQARSTTAPPFAYRSRDSFAAVRGSLNR
jgi:hypothetical protein